MVFDWSAALRTELAQRAHSYVKQSGAPSYSSLGPSPTIFEPFENGTRHGNFADASYRAICGEAAWSARTKKTHSQAQALPLEKRATARELDSCNSSDALLMNCFCYPNAAERILSSLLPGAACAPPEFGVHGKVALLGGRHDATEIDMRIGSTIFEAKLTERDFTRKPKSHIERYSRFIEVFDPDARPHTKDEYQGYQLIRNVLAADQYGWGFAP